MDLMKEKAHRGYVTLCSVGILGFTSRYHLGLKDFMIRKKKEKKKKKKIKKKKRTKKKKKWALDKKQ